MRLSHFATIVGLVSLPAAAWAASPGATAAIGTFFGPYGTTQAGAYGTDLGMSVRYQGNIRFLFGDTWSTSLGAFIGPAPGGVLSDDCQGNVSIASFPDGAHVESWLNASGETPAWRRNAPTLSLVRNGSAVKPFQVYDGGSGGTMMPMGTGKTPLAAFADDQVGGGFFSMFARQVGVFCTTPASCGTGFACDQGMGTCNGVGGEGAIPCVIGTLRCICSKPVGKIGVCQDQTSSMYDPLSEDGRILASVLSNRIGNADPAAPEKYYTKEFKTNKFNNPVTRTVTQFTASQKIDINNNWNPPPGGGGKVLMWGRPNYAAYGSIPISPRSAKLYFAYANMPAYNAAGPTVTFNYFRGYSSAAACTTVTQTPSTYLCFSTDQSQAAPLDLNGGADPTKEVKDVVGSFTVAWVASLGKWVMIYGGDYPPVFLALVAGPNYGWINHNAGGAYYVRFADYPWGPWTTPQEMPGAPGVPGGIGGSYGDIFNPPTLQYGSNGILYSPYCSGGPSVCAVTDPAYVSAPPYNLYAEADKVGRMYGPEIVQEWNTSPAGNPTNDADIYWLTAKWNPYEVVLMRTRLNP